MLSQPRFTGFEKQIFFKAFLCTGLFLFAGALLSAGLEEEEKLYEAEQSLGRVALLSGSVLCLFSPG